MTSTGLDYSAASSKIVGKSEFEVLKSSHRFLREDNDKEPLTWEEQLAKKYYDNLYREYAVCDLKHYKSGNFSLRWRTEDEVLSGAGETTCGNTRCSFHISHNAEEAKPSLKTLELPFSYQEGGESKFALVKVVLCNKCCKKLMWKRNKEKEQSLAREDLSLTEDFRVSKGDVGEEFDHGRSRRGEPTGQRGHKRHRNDSRSRSPPKRHGEGSSRKRSP